MHHLEATTKGKKWGFCVQQVIGTYNLIWLRKNLWQTLIPLIIEAQNEILNICTVWNFFFNLTRNPKDHFVPFLILMLFSQKLVRFGKRYKSLGYCLNKNEELLFLNPNIGRLAKRLPKKCFFHIGSNATKRNSGGSNSASRSTLEHMTRLSVVWIVGSFSESATIVARQKSRNLYANWIFSFQYTTKTKKQLVPLMILMLVPYNLEMFGKGYKSLRYCLNKNEEFIFLPLNFERLFKRLPVRVFLTFGTMRRREFLDSLSRRER